MAEELEQISFNLPRAMVAALRELAAAEDRTMAAEVRRAVRLHLEASGRPS